MKALAQKVNAGNDRNGNPRRGWLVYDIDGSFAGFHDEGYEGLHGLKRRVASGTTVVELAVVLPITLAAYKDLLKRDYR